MTPRPALRTLLAVVSLAATATAPAMAADAPAFQPDKAHTAVLITDPQTDFMSETGKGWGLVGENVTRLDTNAHIAALMETAKSAGVAVFVSPHGYVETDDQWLTRGPVQELLHETGMLETGTPGADFYDPLKPMILDGETVITTPHKIYGPESNDLALQLRKRGIQTVLLGGFVANLCVDSHMRELTEQGFNVIYVSDAVGAPGEAAYDAAILNAGMIANAVWTTAEAVDFLD